MITPFPNLPFLGEHSRVSQGAGDNVVLSGPNLTDEMDTHPGHRQTREMSLEQGLLITALLLYTTSVQTGRVPTHRQGQGLNHMSEKKAYMQTRLKKCI